MLIPEDQIWMVVVGFVVAFVLAFGIGANDVANSFGTSVGAKVLNLRQACILATVCELSGAILLGAKVSNTIRKGIVDTDLFMTIENGTSVLMTGQLAALGGSCIWLLVATFFRLPVSGTHSIVGATVGFSLVVFGLRSVRWFGLLKIVASWFISPLFSGVTSVGMYYILRKLVLSKDEPLEPALRLLPAFYGTVVLVNSFSIFYDGPPMLHFEKIPVYGIFIISCGLGCITLVLVKLFLVPHLRCIILDGDSSSKSWRQRLGQSMKIPDRLRFPLKKTTPNKISDSNAPPLSNSKVGGEKESKDLCTTIRMQKIEASSKVSSPSSPTSVREKQQATCSFGADDQFVLGGGPMSAELTVDMNDQVQVQDMKTVTREHIKDRPSEATVFSFLQILTAVFGSFAHGGNDVSNAIGPLIGLWIIGVTQQIDSKMPTPLWILLYGGLGISVGLWIWGRRVIQTLGEDLTVITPSSGVCIEIGAALTVLVASKIGLPISTTHCKVGSVVAVGRARSKDNVNWGIFCNILIAWLVTLPASGAISALVMFGLSYVI